MLLSSTGVRVMHPVRRSEMDNLTAVAAIGDDVVLQSVATGDMLFQPGDQRQVYRVEEGAICHYIRWADGSHDMVEVAFPGDLVGLGYIGTHVSTAQAMVPTVVSLVSEAELQDELRSDDRLAFQMAGAGEREFDYMRDISINSGKRTPVERVANYLVAVAGIGKAEGHHDIVTDEISSGYVAERLQMSVDALQSALVGLEKKGLVTPVEHGLRITDLAELEKVANAA